MKKNLAARLGVMALVLTLVTSSLVSGTYSKYVTTQAGADTARVARFAFNLSSNNTKTGASSAISQSANSVGTYNIFDYTDSGVYNDGLNGTKFLAPGTTGKFDIVVENLSEVKVAATFNIAETISSSSSTPSSLPIYYTVGTATQRYSSVLTGTYNAGATSPDTGKYEDLTGLAGAMAANSSMSSIAATNLTSGGPKGTVTLNWTWAFDDNSGTKDLATNATNITDTNLGLAGTATDYLKISTTVSQID